MNHTYRGWTIYPGRWPEPEYTALHPDYDASYEGPEDGWVSNGLCVTGSSLDEVKEGIDDMIEEMGL